MVTVFNMYEDAGDDRYFDSSLVFDADGSLGVGYCWGKNMTASSALVFTIP